MKVKPRSSIYRQLPLAIALATLSAGSAQATLLTHKSVSISSTGGLGGAGTSASDMVYNTYSSDGWGWAGGAGPCKATRPPPITAAIPFRRMKPSGSMSVVPLTL